MSWPSVSLHSENVTKRKIEAALKKKSDLDGPFVVNECTLKKTCSIHVLAFIWADLMHFMD